MKDEHRAVSERFPETYDKCQDESDLHCADHVRDRVPDLRKEVEALKHAYRMIGIYKLVHGPHQHDDEDTNAE